MKTKRFRLHKSVKKLKLCNLFSEVTKEDEVLLLQFYCSILPLQRAELYTALSVFLHLKQCNSLVQQRFLIVLNDHRQKKVCSFRQHIDRKASEQSTELLQHSIIKTF